MKHLFSDYQNPVLIRMWCLEKALETTRSFDPYTCNIADNILAYIHKDAQTCCSKTMQYPEYENLYILRDFDLRPEKIKDYPTFVTHELANELKQHGLLFNSEEEALKARELMMKAISI